MLQMWDSDNNADDPMSTKEKIVISPGHPDYIRHSGYSGAMQYDYHFIIDGDECSTNHCQNGGACVDGCAAYSCNCPSSYTGFHCEHLTGHLRIRIQARYARDLPDYDPWWNDSDPYFQVIAIDADGNWHWRNSGYRWGNQNPDWNESLDFGTGQWREIRVRIYDSDDNADDALSDTGTWQLSSLGSHEDVRLNCHSGYAIFDYHFN